MSEPRTSSDEIRRLIEMPRDEFEDLVASLYRALGHQAVCTRAKDTGGVHVIVHATNGQKWIVQCRQWRGAVGEAVVRDFIATMESEQAAQGAIITTAKFTPKARDCSKGTALHLYDGDEFSQAMKRIQGRRPAAAN